MSAMRFEDPAADFVPAVERVHDDIEDIVREAKELADRG